MGAGGTGRNQTVSGRLDGKVAVVTGGASGMGRATVHRFLEEGAEVIIGDLNETNNKDLMDELTRTGSADRAECLRVDVSVEDDVQRMIRAATERFGRLDVVFNNAGLGGAFGPITELDVDDWDFTFHVLVRGVFLGIKHAARVLIEQGEGGSILNTASVAGLCGGNGPQAYSAAKSAVVNLSQSTAIELGPHRIRVNAICPGAILTPLFHQGDPDAATEIGATLQPWPEVGRPEDIAGAALFLASDDSNFVTGHALTVDGGIMAAGPHLYGKVAGTEAAKSMVGVNRGTTGEKHSYRRLGS